MPVTNLKKTAFTDTAEDTSGDQEGPVVDDVSAVEPAAPTRAPKPPLFVPTVDTIADADIDSEPPAAVAELPVERTVTAPGTAADEVRSRDGDDLPLGSLLELLANEPTERLGVRVPRAVASAVRAEVSRRQRDGVGDRSAFAVEVFVALPDEPERLGEIISLLERGAKWVSQPRQRHLEFQVPQPVKDHLDQLLLRLEHHHQRQVTLTDLVIAAFVDRVDPDLPPGGISGAARLDDLLRKAKLHQS